jgi:CRISPR-associated protein Cmr3
MPMFKITPLDPLISRDSRPFGRDQGRKVRTLDWLTPSVVCGSLRSFVGKQHEKGFVPEDLKKINIRGPFLECERSLYFPCPLDFVAGKNMGYALRPSKNAAQGGTEMPLGLSPAFLQNPPEDDFKPEDLPKFWSAEAMSDWLKNPDPQTFLEGLLYGLPGPEKDERVHVSINPETGVSEDSLLFSTTGLDFRRREKKEGSRLLQMTVALEAETSNTTYARYLEALPRLHPLGGERRLAEWKAEPEEVRGWKAPEGLNVTPRLRMILATPAIFSKAWLPGWIDEKSLEGLIPSSDVKVKLVSAVIGRWVPISGWNYAGQRGPKPLRRMAPAGSVYFFENEGGSLDWEKLWLRAVSDDEQDRNDGFGAALWGTW